LFQLIASGVVDTGGKFAAGIVDTGGKFATGVNNTRGTGGKSLPPVSTTLLANNWNKQGAQTRCTLTCEYFREFKNFLNDPNVIIMGLGEGDS
jgi:hypothetical protein